MNTVGLWRAPRWRAGLARHSGFRGSGLLQGSGLRRRYPDLSRYFGIETGSFFDFSPVASAWARHVYQHRVLDKKDSDLGLGEALLGGSGVVVSRVKSGVTMLL